MKSKNWIFLTVLFLVMSMAVTAASENVVWDTRSSKWKETEISKYIPLPPRIKIILPTAYLTRELAAFVGRWEARWEGERQGGTDAILIVTKIDEKKAKAIYGWAYTAWGSGKDCSFYPAKVISNGQKPKIEFFPPGGTATFEMQDDLKTIKGKFEFQRTRNISTITMKKIED